ncbi:methyltransferase domain protein, partial [Bordetella bronchiseptica 00-P-2730]
MEIVPSVSIDNLINQRTAIVHKLEQVFTLLRECDTLAGAAHLDFPEISLESGRWMSHRTRLVGSYADSPEQASRDVLRVLDCSAWQYLMHESGLRTFMDATARQNWNKQIETGDVPELNAQNISATFAALFEARGEMFERGVLACFQGLSWDYKTNQPFKFGKR